MLIVLTICNYIWSLCNLN